MPPNVLFVDFVVLLPGHGRSVTDFWCWDAHEAQLRCPDGVWVVIEEDVVPGGALNLNSTNLPRPWSSRESSPSRKIPTVEPGNRTRDLMISSQTLWTQDHEAGHLCICWYILIIYFNRLTPNNPYIGRITPLTSKRCILYIYSTNIGTEYF